MSDNKLEKRVAALEESLRRLESKNRGYLTQSAAAEYIGRSVEYLRSHHVNGTGPARMPNGMYRLSLAVVRLVVAMGRLQTWCGSPLALKAQYESGLNGSPDAALADCCYGSALESSCEISVFGSGNANSRLY